MERLSSPVTIRVWKCLISIFLGRPIYNWGTIMVKVWWVKCFSITVKQVNLAGNLISRMLVQICEIVNLTLTTMVSLCQRFSLTWSVRNKPRVRNASIECRRRESPPEAKDERSESFAGGASAFAFCFHLFIKRALTQKSKAKPWQKAKQW